MTTSVPFGKRTGLFSPLEPRLGSLEDAYQASVLSADEEQGQLVLLLSVVGLLVSLFYDVFAVGLDQGAFERVPLFATESGLTVACALALRRVTRTRTYEWLALAWSLSYTVFALYLRATDAPVFPQASVVLLVLASYLALPNRFAFRAIPAFLSTAGDWLITFRAHRGPVGTAGALLITYAFVHIVGIWTSTRYYTTRRRHFATEREQEAARAELSHAANHDALTGVLSRARWTALASAEVIRHRRYGRPLTLMMADLDHFKDVNDAFGHEAGDAVLRRFGNILGEQCRRTDIIGRVGGEEFVMLLPETELATALDVGRRIVDACRAPQLIAGFAVSVSCSIGAAAVEPGDLTIEDVLRRADAALYTAKRTGRNRLEIAEPTQF